MTGCRFPRTPGCSEPVLPDGEFCILHAPADAKDPGLFQDRVWAICQAAANAREQADLEGAVFPDGSHLPPYFPGGVNFRRATFTGKFTDFTFKVFDGITSFADAQFWAEDTKFVKAEFKGARTSFVGAVFHRRVVFSHATFAAEITTFERATFGSESLFGATQFRSQRTAFDHAIFRGPVFMELANFTGHASFTHSVLAGASFAHTAFTGGMDFFAADLSGTDLRNAPDIHLDSTFVRGTKFRARAGDAWSRLRRNYTGTMFTIHLILLTAFVLPYIARAGMLLGVNRAQLLLQRTIDVAADRIEADAIRDLTPCLASECKQFPIYQVLLGWDRGFYWSALVGALLLYNVLRGVLTYFVSLMRDAEERSGFTPLWWPRREFNQRLNQDDPPPTFTDYLWSYRWLAWLQVAMNVLIWVALFSFLWHLKDWLTRTIWIPA
jgi:uncharacterized protein YjbI with pentapeptide repeats